MMEGIADDLFGRLPNELICSIISFLPSEYALETSVLSRRWRGLWNTTLVQQIVSVDDVAGVVTVFLSHFDKLDPLRKPRKLRLNFGKGNDLLLATIAPNNKLHLDFSTGKQEVEVPRHFVLQLQLMNHQWVLPNLTHQPCPSTFFVKTLYLKSVSYRANEAVSTMVSNFPFLENLKIIECDGLQSLHIHSSPRLLSLTIFDCPHLKSVHLRSSKLKSFRYRGFLPQIWPETHFNLADAMLDFRQGPGYNSSSSSDFDPMLLTIKNAQVLTLSIWTFQTLIWPSLVPLQANFLFYKLQDLWWIDNEEESFNNDALISFLKLCPALERLFVTIDPTSYCNSTAPLLKKVNSHKELGHLKVIKLQGFTNQEDGTSMSELVRVDPPINVK